jgi:hypothetical protein
MSVYKANVDLSDLFHDMSYNYQKSFLVEEFCSLPIEHQVKVVGEMLKNLNGDQTAKVIEDAFDNLHEQGQEHVINYVNDKVMMSDKQYRVARKGVVEQLKLAQRLHCKHMEQKYKEALEKLEKRFLKPDAVGCFDLGARVSNSYYHL